MRKIATNHQPSPACNGGIGHTEPRHHSDASEDTPPRHRSDANEDHPRLKTMAKKLANPTWSFIKPIGQRRVVADGASMGGAPANLRPPRGLLFGCLFVLSWFLCSSFVGLVVFKGAGGVA